MSIVYIQISYRQKDKKLLYEFISDKPSHLTKHEVLLAQSNLNIPVYINEVSLGKALHTNIENGFITHISRKIIDLEDNFLDFKGKAKILRYNHIYNKIWLKF